MRERLLLLNAVAQPRVVDHVVRANETSQVEGLGRSIEGDHVVVRPVAHLLRGDVLMAVEQDVRPDLVGDDVDVVLLEERHCLLELPALPYAAARVVRRAEDGGVDLVLHDAALHVLKVHAPYATLVKDERAVDEMVAVSVADAREAHVRGGVHEHVVTL